MRKRIDWTRCAAITLLVTLLAGCKAAPAPSAGFADPAVMNPDPTIPFNRFWRKPDVNWKQYDTIYIADVNTSYMLKMTDWQKGERRWDVENDLHTLALYSRNAMIKAFRDDPKHRFKVIDKPAYDSHTLELEMALIEVVPSKVLLNALGYAPFYIGTGITTVRTIANDKSSAAFELRLRDAGTGQVVMQAADREAEQFAVIDVRGLTWYSDLEGIIDDWSRQFVQIANKQPGETIAGSSTFRLLPW
jgi:Protein of unknown function (DUF3313)